MSFSFLLQIYKTYFQHKKHDWNCCSTVYILVHLNLFLTLMYAGCIKQQKNWFHRRKGTAVIKRVSSTGSSLRLLNHLTLHQYPIDWNGCAAKENLIFFNNFPWNRSKSFTTFCSGHKSILCAGVISKQFFGMDT